MNLAAFESWVSAVAIESSGAVLTATALRCVPFGAAALMTDELPSRARAATLVTSGALLSGMALLQPRPWQVWLMLFAAYAYFAALSIGAWAWSRRNMTSKRVVLLGVDALLSVVVPGLLFSGAGKTVALVLGFEYFFALYSYLEERRAGRAPDDLGDCVLFLMVNPTLVYTNKGRRIAGAVPWRAVSLRLGMGVFVLFAHYAATAVLPVSAAFLTNAPHEATGVTLMALALMWAQLVAWYWAHSATASLQIAGMRALGWEIPERYRFPFLARSPEDFWKRWNVYLGQWFYKYAFLPLGLVLLRRRKVLSGDGAKVVALLATFTMCGIAHDLNAYMNFRRTGGGATLGFLFAGTVVLVWAWIARAWRRASTKRTIGYLVYAERFVAALSPFALVCLITAMGWVFLPALAGRSLAETFRR